MACHYLWAWGRIATAQYVLVDQVSVGVFYFSRVKIRVNYIVNWAFAKARGWVLSFSFHRTLASPDVIQKWT